MEPQFQVSTRMTGGYLAKSPRYSTEPKTVYSLFQVKDVVRLIVYQSGLSTKDQAHCAIACKAFREILKSKEQYCKWQFQARLVVLKSVTSDPFLEARLRELLNSKSDLTKCITPTKSSLFTSLFGNAKKETQDNLLLECQSKIIDVIGRHHGFHIFNSDQLPIPVEDPTNEYEMQAYHDTIYPAVKRVIDHMKPQRRELPMSGFLNLSNQRYDLPAFLCMAEAILKESKVPHQQLGNAINIYDRPEYLRRLNQILRYAEHLEMLTFSGVYGFKWATGEGFAVFSEGLIRAPKLRILHFDQLGEHLIDVNNALAIADIVKRRQKMKKLKPFEEIRLGNRCITQEAAFALIKALQDYPVPIIIFISKFGNIPNPVAPQQPGNPTGQNLLMDILGLGSPFPIEEIRKIGRNVNLRWDAVCPEGMKLDLACALDEHGNEMRVMRKSIEIVEAKRNKGHTK